ncbi:MAG: anion transporter [Chthoniobacterales bacterium]|nr:anion transporter [Chthoniobacterales bacterium]
MKWIAVAIFALTYVIIGIGRLPPLRIDRAGAALLGAALMVACGVLTLPEAYRAIDFDTITLLLGMMIVVANLRLSGFFGVVNNWGVTRARHPLILLVAVTLVSGIFSAFLVNDTICIVLTPLVFELVTRLRRNPIPYLLAVAMASNVGSTATITGNPQNIIIGSLSHIPYGRFAAALSPIAAIGLALTAALLAFFFPNEFWTRARLEGESFEVSANWPLLWKAVLLTAAMVVAFFLGQPAAKVAILAGALLLLTRRLKPAKVYREIDWSLLVMFSGLFIVVAALEKSVLDPQILAQVKALHLEKTALLSFVTAALSNLVSNVPAVLVLKPFIAQLADQQRAWLVVAMASTLAGNFTILGSIANLIVVQRARAHHIEISFWTYFKVGAPLTILTILVGVLWL